MTDTQAEDFKSKFEAMTAIVRANPDNGPAQAIGSLATQIVRLLVESQYTRSENQTTSHGPAVH